MDLDAYLKRFNGRPAIVATKPRSNLSGVIVIPCFREPDWELTLQSLITCEPPSSPIEVLIVLNDSEADAPEVHSENQDLLKAISQWSMSHDTDQLQFHVINALGLPKKNAGVGLARKIGMDEALHRLTCSGNLERGWIAGLDADCLCQPNYLNALDNHFRKNPHTSGCSVYYEHPLEGPLPQEIYNTAARYELHLRYYVEALRHAGFPHAYHTIGSAMAATARTYMAQGGMNRRKAGEDFYFLNKIISSGHFTELNSTIVIPSPRTSDRVPFGTGRAVAKYYGQDYFPTYSWKSIQALKTFFETVRLYDPFTQRGKILTKLQGVPSIITDYIETVKGWEQWQKCIDGTNASSAYLRRFFQWFDAFQCMKCLHFMRDNGHGEMDVLTAAQSVLRTINTPPSPQKKIDEVCALKFLRERQKSIWKMDL
ncbi:MAG: glycosyltransferase [Limisphaerales bacterium]|nr:hypothetical protein [Verrucomicrobiales bacterium]HBP54503.1 hypothetical protein [Verrucomicrobiales bacterium]